MIKSFKKNNREYKRVTETTNGAIWECHQIIGSNVMVTRRLHINHFSKVAVKSGDNWEEKTRKTTRADVIAAFVGAK